MSRRVGREEGILIGISAGANLVAARKLGNELARDGKPGVIVTFLCDGAAKYLSEPFWDE
jgi:cysteine synthase B